MNRKNLFFIMFSVTALLSACDVTSPSSFTESDTECISPPVTFGFPYSATMPSDFEPKEVFPPKEWQPMVEFSHPYGSIRSLVVRSGNEIWVLTFDAVFKYQTDTRKLRKYESIGNVDARPSILFVSNDNTLWGIDPSYIGDVPLLSRYNEKTDRFEFVDNYEGELGVGIRGRFSSPIGEDHAGRLWMILAEGKYKEDGRALYGFNPATLQVEYRVETPQDETFNGLAVAPDGTIWMGGDTLYQYIPSTGELEAWSKARVAKIMPSKEITNTDNMYFDRRGYLWFDDQGWLEFSSGERPVFYQLVRSPVFISDNLSPEAQNGWIRPSSIYQSSNGIYWFSATVGIVRLDLESEEWCLFTTGYSPVVEDGDHNLWIAVFGQLFKLPPEND